jgi:hypothetical protein
VDLIKARGSNDRFNFFHILNKVNGLLRYCHESK